MSNTKKAVQVPQEEFAKKEQLKQEIATLEKQKAAFDAAVRFAKQTIAPIWNTADQSTKESITYSRFTKEDLLSYMQTPTSNERNLRNASIYMWDASSQYRRLIEYYAMLPLWDYILVPLDYDPTKTSIEKFRKQYAKVQTQTTTMNLKHEIPKAVKITYRDGVLFGAMWKSNTAFFVQRINPDYCTLTGIVDGTWQYAVDMSKIAEKKLPLYPPEFTTMYNAYRSGGNKWQDVPIEISFCLKADETVPTYSIPPWAATLPMLYDIETYKALQETATKISNYKLLGMQIELNDDGTPSVSWDLAEQYYRQLQSVLPPYVGAFVSPMKTTSYEFEKSGTTNDVDTVSRAEEQYWFNTGTSALLHGSNTANTAGALKLSIRSDEEVAFSMVNQVERLLNRIILAMSPSVKFQLKFLPTTRFNHEDMVKIYKEAATLGVPGAKTAYAVASGIPQAALVGMTTVEDEILGADAWKPLQSSYTTSSADSAGRPAARDEDLDDEGAATRESGANENR